jgi:hypothetical protein
MKRLIYIILIIFLGACKAEKTGQQALEDNRPYWLQNRPMEQAYYIGIGASVKRGQETDYMAQAKKQALGDLASEIRVNLESNSMLYMLDKGHSFKEEYISSVKTHTQEELEGYEMAGSWENEREYWVYYRLSKAKWKALQERKKQEAVTKALDFFVKARGYEKQAQIRQALSAYLKSLETLKEYYAEAIEVDIEGQKILLLNEAYDAVRKILGHAELIPDQKNVTIKRGMQQQAYLNFTAVYRDPKTGELMPFRRFPVKALYGSGVFEKEEKLISDQQGHLGFAVSAAGKESRQEIHLRADHQELVNTESQERFVRKIVETAAPANASVLLQVQAPVVYLNSKELNLEEALPNKPVASMIRDFLSQNGFVFTENPAEAELLVQIEANTRKGGAAAEFQTTYLDVEVSVNHLEKNVVIFSEVLRDVKGVHLSYEQAGMVAYKKSGEMLERKLLPELLKKLL